MATLLDEVLEAHGGLDRWRQFSRVEADAVTGGGMFPLKGLMPDLSTRRMTVWLKEERASVLPFGAPDQRTSFTPERLAIEKLDGTVVAEWPYPRSSFIGHGLSTAWAPVHRAYFNGYAMWTYLNTPFVLKWPGVEVAEEGPWTEGDETWGCSGLISQASLSLTARCNASILGPIAFSDDTITMSISQAGSRRRN